MVTMGNEHITAYDRAYDQLRLLLSSNVADADHAARAYIDRAVVVSALEHMGAIPRGDVAHLTAYAGIMHIESTDVIDRSLAGPAQDILKCLYPVFDRRDTLKVACALLDHSASAMHGDKARDAGVYYTPMPVANYIVRKAIGSYLANKAKITPGTNSDTIGDHIGSAGIEGLNNICDSLKTVTVLDSSCGSGIFLEAALNELYRLRALALDRASKLLSSYDDSQYSDLRADIAKNEYLLKKEIVEQNLYGTDIEGYSVEVSSIRLKLLLAAFAGQLEPVEVHVACRNVLLEKGPFDSRIFDVIVGNPPYVRVKSMFAGTEELERARMKKDLASAVYSSGLYRYQEGNLNLYKLFIERNLSLLKDKGSMGLIVPSSFLNEATSERLRKHLFETCTMEEIVELPERSRVFVGVNQATAIFILHKATADEGSFKLKLGADAISLDRLDSMLTIGNEELATVSDGRMEVPLLTNPSLEWDMIRQLRNIPPFKGSEGIAPVGYISVGNVDETIDKGYISESSTGYIFVKGVHLKEYSVDLTPNGKQPRWVRKDAFLKARPSAQAVISMPRIIGRNTQNKACSRRLKFAPLPAGYLCSNSIKQIIVTDKAIEPFYLLALLNSAVLNWYFELFCEQNNIRNYRIEGLPIIRVSQNIQAVFVRIARLIMSSDSDIMAREFLDKRLMDAMAYELYFKGEYRLIDTVSQLMGLEDSTLITMAMNDPGLKEMIEGLMNDDRFIVIRKATYKKWK